MSQSKHRPARFRRVLIASLCVFVAAAAVLAAVFVPRILGDRAEQTDLADFYKVSAEDAVSGDAGSLVRVERLQGVPFDAEAWRILYRTTDLNGTAQLASGIVVTPLGKAPSGGRTVLAWGHPTTGVSNDCAPSRGFDPFIGIEGLREMLDRGYTVAATDYVGMGVDGPDSYLVGETAAHSVLDSVRAARSIPEAEASDSVVLWGHSQGGQAVLFAAEAASDYAPELQIDAVAVAAPAANLGALMQAHLSDISGATIGSYAFQAYSEVYSDRGADLNTVLTPEAQGILKQMNSLCLLTNLDELHKIAEPVVGNFFLADPSKTEPWATLLQENSVGTVSFDAPLFVAQGLKDELVIPDDTREVALQLEKLGMDVTYHPINIADHSTVAYLSLFALDDWLNEKGV